MITRYRNALVRWTADERDIINGMEGLYYGRASFLQYGDAVGSDDAVVDFTTRTSGPHNKKILNRRVGAYFSGAEKEPDFSDLGEFEITYSFSNKIRNNTFPTATGSTGKYGSAWSYRMLYDYLCLEYNGGHYFIDDYFEQMRTRPWYPEFTHLQQTVRSSMAREIRTMKESALRDIKGRFTSETKIRDVDMRREVERINEKYGEWKNYEVFKQDSFRRELKDFAAKIRDDCVVALNTGLMPLRGAGQSVSAETKRKRGRFPSLDPSQMFYASGSLIEHLNIFISLDKEAV